MIIIHFKDEGGEIHEFLIFLYFIFRDKFSKNYDFESKTV
ncbi:hypothetical protein NIES80_10240 [Dolichospermum planctonicum]|uniref:Uncharacterized protein n=1 Tax=Dolichospermum planctonicum TaxID=136072 RepID=A0A480A8Y9_9CYAN|nr:hypothetical protein NIES80_10240 [Dolichospermum planctonicum]